MGTSEAPRGTAAGRWQAGALLVSAAWCRLRPADGRPGAVGGPHGVARRSSGPRPGSQLVSTKSLAEVHRRMTRRSGVPQVGHVRAMADA
jgi:hypothetical protein